MQSASDRNATRVWNSAWVPTAICAAPDSMSAQAARWSGGLPAGEQDHANTERLEPGGQIVEVLFGQDLGRRQHGDLLAVLGSPDRSERGDHRLA